MRVHADLASSGDRSNAGAQGVPQQVQGALLGPCNTPTLVEPQSFISFYFHFVTYSLGLSGPQSQWQKQSQH